ncbi:hypothetical protein QBC34DRAFT_495382 [Podospora aff. communis PSN243]|uniref:Heterokaryon incompatibility domain-containing protein n=1 Tax=Podospora aff. communis PSN243 TaxID=3040156 RepID=A0AAV9GJL9_9PEZI|nr:hypothetical protein QBC34DRAFT_495382 [Podospora aff. communis PSN243]
MSSLQEARSIIRKIWDANTIQGQIGKPGCSVGRMLENALSVLSRDLYGKPTHFLMEMIQNADDNTYNADAPTLKITYRPGALRVDCNEIGFSQENVEAICNIGQSTKTGLGKATRYIGEKGIGFKSVFKVAKVVYIKSGYFSFKFRQIIMELRELDAKMLMFLRQLRRIQIDIGAPRCGSILRNLERHDKVVEGALQVTLLDDSQSATFIVIKHSVGNMPEEEKRPSCTETELLLAFPAIDPATFAPLKNQSVYAFLPIRDCGLKFSLQGDFILTANREDVMDSPWNRALLEASAHAFVSAVRYFNAGRLGYSWPRYFPENDLSGFFNPLGNMIKNLLRNENILETWDRRMTTPASVVYVPDPQYVCANSIPLTLSSRSKSVYLSKHYRPGVMRFLSRIDVKYMGDDMFMRDFKWKMEHESAAVQNQPGPWQTQLARALQRMVSNRDYREALRGLPLIPLRGDRWVPANGGPIFFNKNPRGLKIPTSVAISTVDEEAESNRIRRGLLVELGVKPCDGVEISLLILERHQSKDFDAQKHAVKELIEHAVFMFQAKFRPPVGSFLWFATAQDGRCRGSSLYMHGNQPANSPIAIVMKEMAKKYPFIHPGYREALPGNKDWLGWIRNSFDVAAIPRIAYYSAKDDGDLHLSSEFGFVCRSVPSPVFLDFLLNTWGDYSSWIKRNCEDSSDEETAGRGTITSIASMSASTRSDGKAALKDTVLPGLDHEVDKQNCKLLLRLPEGHADTRKWAFLDCFGVSTLQNPPKRKWVTTEECVERGFNIESEYDDSALLWRCLLSKGSGEMGSLVATASMISMSMPLKSILERLKKVSRSLFGHSSDQAKRAVAALIDKDILPIRAGKGTKEFEKLVAPASGSVWFIADRDHLQESFVGILVILSLLLAALGLENRALSALVESQFIAQGRLRPHPVYTDFLQARAPFLISLIPSADAKHDSRVTQLKGVTVSTAAKVVCRYSFEFKKRNDRLNLYIADDETDAFPPPLEMVKIIHNHCGIKKGEHRDLANLALTEKNEEKIRKEFQKEGFYISKSQTAPQHPGNNNRSKYIDSKARHTSDPYKRSDPQPQRDTISGVQNGRDEPKAKFASVYSYSLRDREVNEEDENDRRLPSKRYLTLKRKMQVPKGVPKVKFSDHQNGTDGSQKPTEYGNVQFLGELMASLTTSKLLQQHLGALYHPEKHWTSSHRSRAGYKTLEFSPVNYAPFTFTDQASCKAVAGCLIGPPFQYAQPGQWGGRHPRYHLDVAVSMDQRHPGRFMWTGAQFETIRKFRSQPLGTGPPSDVAILIYVSDVHSSPRFKLFPAPWGLVSNADFTLWTDCGFTASLLNIPDTYGLPAIVDDSSLPHTNPYQGPLNPTYTPWAASAPLYNGATGPWANPNVHHPYQDRPGYFQYYRGYNAGVSHPAASSHLGYSLPFHNSDDNTIFAYKPLAPNHIRLLLLPPGSGSALRGTLIDVPLSSPGRYQAVSYTWGIKPTPSHSLHTTDGTIKISANLRQVLTSIRDPTEVLTLWIDAICINQSDSDEKVTQIRLLPHIFQSASRVLAFIHTNSTAANVAEGVGSADAIQTLLQIHAREIVRTCNESWPPELAPVPEFWGESAIPPFEDPVWEVIRAFFKAAWFERAWIIQEVVAAFRRFRSAASTLQRDRLFCLLGLAADGNEEEFAPDYTAPFEAIVRRFASGFVRKGYVLELMHNAGMGSEPARFPSWIPNWRVPKPPGLRSLVVRGMPAKASPSPTAVWKLEAQSDEIEVQATRVDKVALVSTTQNTTEDKGAYAHLQEVEKMLESRRVPGANVLKWKVPVAGCRHPAGSNATSSMQVDMEGSYRAFMEYYQWKKPQASARAPSRQPTAETDVEEDWTDVKTKRKRKKKVRSQVPSELRAAESQDGQRSNDAAAASLWIQSQAYLASLRDEAIRNWRMVVTERNFTGLAPANVRVGDEIAVFDVGMVPFVIRGSEWRRGAFQLVGECFVEGFMEGEAVSMHGVKKGMVRLH